MRGAKQKEMFEISDLRRRVRSVCPFVPQCVCVCVWGGGGGGTLIFSYIRRLWLFLGLKILNFNFFLFLFWGGGCSDDFVDIFFWGGRGGVITNWTIFRGHFYAF